MFVNSRHTRTNARERLNVRKQIYKIPFSEQAKSITEYRNTRRGPVVKRDRQKSIIHLFNTIGKTSQTYCAAISAIRVDTITVGRFVRPLPRDFRTNSPRHRSVKPADLHTYIYIFIYMCSKGSAYIFRLCTTLDRADTTLASTWGLP